MVIMNTKNAADVKKVHKGFLDFKVLKAFKEFLVLKEQWVNKEFKVLKDYKDLQVKIVNLTATIADAVNLT